MFGTVVHEMCDYHVNHGTALDLIEHDAFDQMVEEILTEKYDWSLSKIPSAKYREFRKSAIDAYRLWVFQVYEHYLVPNLKGNRRFYTEEDLYLQLDDGIWARGTPDLGTLGGMWDYKTTSGAFKWNQQKVDTEFQATYYLALHNYTFGSDWWLDSFNFVVYDRKKHDWNVLPTTRTQEQMDASLRIAVEYGRQMKADVYPATPFVEDYGKVKQGWYCSPRWCTAWNVCEYKQIGTSDPNEEAIVEWR